MPESTHPKTVYEQRLAERTAEAGAQARREGLIANLRLAVFALGVGWLILSWGDGVRMLGLAVPVIGFAALAISHDRTLRHQRDAENAVAYYQRGLDRLNNRWQGKGIGGDAWLPRDHGYARDLDLFGAGSLFELLCTARTRGGEQALAAWLCEGASPDAVEERQQGVSDLRDNIDLRETMALAGSDLRGSVNPEALVEWATAPQQLTSKGVRTTAWFMPMVVLAGAMVWWWTGIPVLFTLGLIGELIVLALVGAKLRRVMQAVEEPCRELDVLRHVVEQLERQSFNAALPKRLQAELTGGGRAASGAIARLDKLVGMVDAQRNQLFAPIAVVLMWPVHVSYALEAWRAEHGAAVGRWLEAVGQLEALCAVAGYAYEHPGDAFPEIVRDEVVYEGKALGHPLIPADTRVRNDLKLGGEPCVYVVTGSNMSGKSTLLRTVGVNAVLAYAGAPVCAESLRLSVFRIGATMRIEDSIQDGTSRFYAEVKRLKHIVDLAGGDQPLLFLLDEIFHGTNSHDRAIGAEAIVRELIETGALGLVTSHDLALAQTADRLAPRTANVHFEDQFESGRLVFDYTLRPGVVTKSNALELMRSVGLRVQKMERE